MSMSLYATRDDYDKAQARRGMGFWDSLDDSEQDLCRRAVAEIAAARDE